MRVVAGDGHINVDGVSEGGGGGGCVLARRNHLELIPKNTPQNI